MPTRSEKSAQQDVIEERWRRACTPTAGSGSVNYIVARTGHHEHEFLATAALCKERGLIGDRWELGESPEPDAQVSLMMTAAAETICNDEHPLHLPGDNLLVTLDLSQSALAIGARLRVGTATLVIGPVPHTGCDLFTERFGSAATRWVNSQSGRERRLRGVYARIAHGGSVSTGDSIAIIAD